MSRRVPSRAHARVLHRDRWEGLQVTGRRLASAEFIRVFPGYFTPAAFPASLNEVCRVLQEEVLPGAVISHSTAAVLFGIPVPVQLDNGVGLLSSAASGHRHQRTVPTVLPPADPWAHDRRIDPPFPMVHCRTGPGGTSRIAHGARLHRLPPGPTVQWGTITLSSPLEVLRELATVLPVWDVTVTIDGLVGPKTSVPGTSLDQVRSFASRLHGRRGSTTLRRAADLARENVESPGESYSRLLTVAAGFPEPTPNLRVFVPFNGITRRIDNGWEQWQIGMEYDGDWRRSTRTQWRDDEARRDDLTALGWTLRRQTGGDLKRPLPFLLKLRATMAARGAPVPSPERIRRFVGSLRHARCALMYGSF